MGAYIYKLLISSALQGNNHWWVNLNHSSARKYGSIATTNTSSLLLYLSYSSIEQSSITHLLLFYDPYIQMFIHFLKFLEASCLELADLKHRYYGSARLKSIHFGGLGTTSRKSQDLQN